MRPLTQPQTRDCLGKPFVFVRRPGTLMEIGVQNIYPPLSALHICRESKKSCPLLRSCDTSTPRHVLRNFNPALGAVLIDCGNKLLVFILTPPTLFDSRLKSFVPPTNQSQLRSEITNGFTCANTAAPYAQPSNSPPVASSYLHIFSPHRQESINVKKKKRKKNH